MLYITQLIFILEGKETVFHEFEEMAIPLLSKYGGKVISRIRTDEKSFIGPQDARPYEIHVISFPTELQFESFVKDETRKAFLHLKEASINESILIKGKLL